MRLRQKTYNPSSTACYGEYIVEDFQLTLLEAVNGIRYTVVNDTRYVNVLPEFFLPTRPRLIMIDNQLYFLVKGTPPDLKSLPEDAGILQVV